MDCIRKWRQEKQFDNKIIRSCPECRVQSDFVCPSRYWCETKEEKEQLITDYKKALRYCSFLHFKDSFANEPWPFSNKACKYFNQGQGECPFGNRCFYLHALPDGTKADVGPPQGKLRRRRIGQDEEEVLKFVKHVLSPNNALLSIQTDFLRVLLWDFLDERENRFFDELGFEFDEWELFGSDSDEYFSDEPDALFFFH